MVVPSKIRVPKHASVIVVTVKDAQSVRLRG